MHLVTLDFYWTRFDERNVPICIDPSILGMDLVTPQTPPGVAPCGLLCDTLLGKLSNVMVCSFVFSQVAFDDMPSFSRIFHWIDDVFECLWMRNLMG